MKTYYVVLRIEAEDDKDADKFAEGVADDNEVYVEWVGDTFDVQYAEDGLSTVAYLASEELDA